MNVIICKECGYSVQSKGPGFQHCPQCQKEVKFIKFEAFCGAKPDELHERN